MMQQKKDAVSMAAQDKLLTGVKVVGLATFLAAAAAGRFLADGAAFAWKDRRG